MKIKEIRALQETERHQKLNETRQEIFNLRFQLATGKTGNPKRIHALKKDVARILTALNEKKSTKS